MSVYVKGMEMPKGCFFCPFNKHLDPDTDKCVLTRDAFDSTFRVIEHRRDNCPLFPVPPHGRLIDADALKAKQQEDADLFINAVSLAEKSRRDEALNAVANIVNAPTIIPAEEREL